MANQQMNQPLINYIAEVISNGDDAHHFRESAAEAIMYVAAWLHEEGFWQAASVLSDQIPAADAPPTQPR
jgi:hypothetical protein